jgi:hypothetical protein
MFLSRKVLTLLALLLVIGGSVHIATGIFGLLS